MTNPNTLDMPPGVEIKMHRTDPDSQLAPPLVIDGGTELPNELIPEGAVVMESPQSKIDADAHEAVQAYASTVTPADGSELFAPRPQQISDQFRRELTSLINCHSLENASGTPDFILADMLIEHLEAYNKAAWRNHQWRSPKTTSDEAPHAVFTFDKQTEQ